jgi:6-phosphogluconolactonase (cycloisomerase 2 family)
LPLLVVAGVAAVALESSVAVGAAAPPHEVVFVTNSNHTIGIYSTGSSGKLVSHGTATIGASGVPYGMAVAPNGRSLYVGVYAGGAGSIYAYSIGAGGTLRQIGSISRAAPVALAVSRDGKYLYAISETAGSLSSFAIGHGGMPSNTPAVTVKTGQAPDAIAVAPNGRYVYVADQFGSGSGGGAISQYTVGSGGRLTPDHTPAVASGNQPDGIVISPSGRYVYVSNFTGSAGVSQYTVGHTGMLSLDKVPAVKAGLTPHGIAISPNGRAVYVATENQTPGSKATTRPGGVSQYTVSKSSGMLTSAHPSAVTAGLGSFSLTTSGDGRFVYVVNAGATSSGTISTFAAGAHGALGQKAVSTLKVAMARPVAVDVASLRY